MKKLIALICGILSFPFISNGQCPTASYTNPGIVCAKTPVTINNISSGASTYQWDFCGGDFSQPYSYAVDDPSSPNGAASISLVNDGTNWYGFLFNYSPSSITRYDFGSSLDNTPTIVDLGNLGGAIINTAFYNDMSFIKEGNNWYGVFGIYGATEIVLVSFGPNLNNSSPIITVNNNTAGQNSLCFQDMKIDGGNIYLLLAIDYGGRILRLNYGNSITNTPAADVIDLSSFSYNEFGDISLVKYCNHWYGFVASYTTSSVVRLDFGNSLNNAPSIVDLGNPNGVFTHPWSIQVEYDGYKWYGFEMNYYGSFNRIDFGKDLTNTSPTGVNLDATYSPGINGTGTSVKTVKANSACYLFTCSVANSKFSKIKYESPCSVNPQTSTQINPVAVFDSGGAYIVSLSATDSTTGNINYFSDTVIVKDAPSANFSFQNTCFNDNTAFQNLSSFSQGTITGRMWNFGDTKTDTVLNPTHKYLSPGKYNVSLTVSGSTGCNAAYSDTVIIGDVPIANFSATTGCSNIPVNFTDLSTVGFSNTIDSWHWDFGDGDTSNVQNPVYKYPAGGTYTVTLNVTTGYNCSSSKQLNVSISDAPKAGFIVTNTCVGGTANFTDTSSINSGSISGWQWKFGDSGSSTLQNPSHPYPITVATYKDTLIVQSLNGCSDTAIRSVKINNVPVSKFSFSPIIICEGNTVDLTDSSTVAGDTIYAWHWDFGDSDTSVIKNPLHTFSSAGIYNIVLTVYSQTSCGASSTQMVTVVNSPTAGFIYTPTCFGDTTRFTDTSTPPLGTTIKSRHWDFGDGDISNITNPVHLYDSAGTYLVSLIVTDSIGCTNTFVNSVAVHHPPDAMFDGNIGCSSAAITFVDSSISTDGAISSYSWTFGDPASGSADSSADPGPSHTYYTAGVYSVSLLITSTFGCSDTFTLATDIQQASAANFQYKPSCQEQQMSFTNLDTLPSLDSAWSWSFGDGPGGSQIPSPSHYYLFPGTYNVTLTVTSKGGCVNTITKLVEVSPNPIAGFVTTPACLNAPYLFQDTSNVVQGNVQKWFWTFGNGDSSYMQFPTTIYSDTGDHNVTLTITTDTTGAACTSTTTETIHVYPLPTANFNYNPLFGSPPLTVNFNDLSIGASLYLWHFGDGDSSNSSAPSYTYLDTGKFDIIQVVYSMQGCIDSVTKVIYVIKPNLDIAVTGVSYQLQNNLFKVSAQVANLGTRDIYNYRMQASIQDGATIDEYVNNFLPSGAQGIVTYNFTASFEISPEQNINYYCVSAVNPNGETDDNPNNNEKCATLTNSFSVVQPYPNPFIDQLQLQFILPYKDQITVELFDNIGQKISTLYNDIANGGETILQVSTAALENQIYFCRFTFRDQTLVLPIVKISEKK